MSEEFSINTPIRPSISRSSSFSSLRSGMERYGEELSSEGLILLGELSASREDVDCS